MWELHYQFGLMQNFDLVFQLLIIFRETSLQHGCIFYTVREFELYMKVRNNPTLIKLAIFYEALSNLIE